MKVLNVTRKRLCYIEVILKKKKPFKTFNKNGN